MENIDKNFFLCEKCQNTCSCAAWFRLIVHWAWWPLMTGAITQPDERLSWRGPETGQTDRARGHLQVEKFCSVPPVAGMKPSGPSGHHYWGMVRGADHFRFLFTVLLVCFLPHWCKVRKTFNATKIRRFFLLCVFSSFCLHLWLYLDVSCRSRALGPDISEPNSDGYEH